MKLRISIRIEDREKYLMHLDKNIFPSPKSFILSFGNKFGIPEKSTYLLLIEPGTIVVSLDQISNNDRGRLTEKQNVQDIVKEELLLRQKAMDERGRLISSGQWLELKNQNTNRYKTAQELLKKSYEISRYQRDTEVEDPMPLVKQEHELLEDYSVGAEMRRNFKMRCIIPRIAKLREPDGHEMKLTRGLQIKTPNFEIFSKAILHVSTRKQLAQTVKLLAMLNGFRLIVPGGNRRERRSTFRCWRSRPPKHPGHKNRIMGPFGMIFAQVSGKPNYHLARYRSVHNHPLDEVGMFAGEKYQKEIDYIINQVKTYDGSFQALGHKTEKASREDKGFIPSEYDLHREYNELKNGLIGVEDLTILRPNIKSSMNSKIVQGDELIKSSVGGRIESGDIINYENDGKQSNIHINGVLLDSREYDERSLDDLKPRRLILEHAKVFEKELLEEYYPQFHQEEYVNLEDKKYKFKSESDVFSLTLLDELPRTEPVLEELIPSFNTLDRVSEKVSPYRIYEVPEEWDDSLYDPLEVAQGGMPDYIMNNPCLIDDRDNDSSQTSEIEIKIENGKINRVPSTPSTSSKKSQGSEDSSSESDSEEEDWKGLSSESHNLDYKPDPSEEDSYRIFKAVDIHTEVMQEILDDVSGVESNPEEFQKKIFDPRKLRKIENKEGGQKRPYKAESFDQGLKLENRTSSPVKEEPREKKNVKWAEQIEDILTDASSNMNRAHVPLKSGLKVERNLQPVVLKFKDEMSDVEEP